MLTTTVIIAIILCALLVGCATAGAVLARFQSLALSMLTANVTAFSIGLGLVTGAGAVGILCTLARLNR